MLMTKIVLVISLLCLFWFHYSTSVFEQIIIAIIFLSSVSIIISRWFPIWLKGKFSINNNNIQENSKSNENIKKYDKNQSNYTKNNSKSNKNESKQSKNPSKYYPELKQSLINCSKTGKLTREMILTFLSEVDYRLKTHKFVYDKFEFQNDMHQIYVKIQSRKLQDQDYVYLINYEPMSEK